MLPLLAQQTRQYSFTHYGPGAGLISNEVYVILQDGQRYIWIGTNNGLQRFDGVRYLTFRHEKGNPGSLPNNTVSQIILGKDDNLWLQLGDGRIGIFDTRRFTFREVKVQYKYPSSAISEKKLLTDEQGNIMLLVMKWEFLVYDQASDAFAPKPDYFSFPREWEIIDFKQQPGTRKFWMGSKRGLMIYNAETRKVSYGDDNVEKEPVLNYFKYTPWPADFFFDRQGRVWFEIWQGGAPLINCYDLQKKQVVLEKYTFFPYLRTYHEMRGFIQQRDGTIWIKGRNVFAHFDERGKQFQFVYNGYMNEQSIVYEGVSSLYEDNENNIWVGTTNNGVFRFNPSQQYFTNIHHTNPNSKQLGNGSVMSFLLARDSTLLVGTWGDGMFRYDKNLNPLPHGIRGFIGDGLPLIWDMAKSRDEDIIWMGAQPGLYAYNQRTNVASYHNPAILRGRTVRQLKEDRFGNLWIGTQSIGLFKWTRGKAHSSFDDAITPFTAIPEVQVLKLYNDSHGLLWVGTSSGVFVIDPATDKLVLEIRYKMEDGKQVPINHIPGILEYDDSTMIMGGGTSIHVYNRNTKQTQSIGSQDFLNGSISSIEKDKKSNYVWVSMSHGLHRVNVKNKIFVHFDRVDGITNDRFVAASSFAMPDGRLLFGADNQFTIFDPSQVNISNSNPPVTITEVRLMNEPLLVDSLLKLDHLELRQKANSISISFSGLSYGSAYNIRYMLEGLDKDWKIADKNNQAIYSYLPPGTYTFLARSEDADGKAGKDITRLRIVVKPPFWRTWWFFGLIILLGAIILYLIDRERIRRLNDLQRVRTEIATNLHEDVTATLSNINLLGEMAKMKADKDIDRSKEYIDQISTKSHNMIIAMDDILWSIDPENDSMEKTLLRMMEYTDSLKNRHGAVIDLALDKRVRSLKLDMKTRHEFFLIFKEGLKMIVQYAQGRNTLVNIDLFKNRLSMRLQDAGARLDTNIMEIEQIIKEINTRSSTIRAELDIQYDRGGVGIVLMIPVK